MPETLNDTGDSSSSPSSRYSCSESPYSSPSQQVYALTNVLTELSCEGNDTDAPHLRILEQPQSRFRFRYKSEMVGTHGCLLGKSTSTSKSKTYPTVELMNWKGAAQIKCSLIQHDNYEEHPHRLLEDEQDKDVCHDVPFNETYQVGFGGMGIIHTAKKDVPTLLYKKAISQKENVTAIERQNIKTQCEMKAKTINLNIVRLKFSAFDSLSGKELCYPVYSEPIHNMKSAATNDLKINRMSKTHGKASGRDDIILLVEKINKKNISIRFFEMTENGERGWSQEAYFLQTDVHHQYAIFFRTPQYKDINITSDAQVYIELYRPSDGETSEPKSFTFKPDPWARGPKKRKANSSYSSFESSTGSLGGSINSMSEVPVPVSVLTAETNATSNDILGGAMYDYLLEDSEQRNNAADLNYAMIESPWTGPAGPMLGQPNVPDMKISFNSNEFATMREFYNTPSAEQYLQINGQSKSSLGGLEDFLMQIKENNQVVSDSGRRKSKEMPSPSKSPKKEIKESQKLMKDNSTEYSAFYTESDGLEVKELVKKICEMIRNKTTHNDERRRHVREKLERLFELRLSNRDAFLHMTLHQNPDMLKYIVRLISLMDMTHLLNCVNNQLQTVLHLAVVTDMPDVVTFLVSKGCDPSLQDDEGNNCIHYAVMCKSCLDPLLTAIEKNCVRCDLNAFNNDRQTPLHLAADCGSESSVLSLLGNGADITAKDNEGRTPIHLAALNDRLRVMEALLRKAQPSIIDAVDKCSRTALQILCSGQIRNNTLAMAKLLLDKKADPIEENENKVSALMMARDKPDLLKLITSYINAKDLLMYNVDIKSDPDDDYDTAEEDDCDVFVISSYVNQISAILDANKGWRRLAVKLNMDSLMNWFDSTPSPTRTLLTHIKEYDENMTSKTLALVLDAIEEKESANIVRRYLKS